MMENGTLKGLRVIDFGQYIAGPMAAMILADYGADVIHVDPPGGPRWNAYEANAVLMRGKRNITLDLKDPDDLAIAYRLIETADVVIENFRPGVMSRFGLGKENFYASNPALIYCSIPGFSERDARAGLRGWEGIIAAEAGLYTGMRTEVRFNALPLASIFAAAQAVHSIIAALIVREKCGKGQSVEVPLYDACFEVQGINGTAPRAPLPSTPGDGKRVVRDYDLVQYLAKYPTKDGRYIQITPPPRGVKNLVDAFIPEEWATHKELTPEEDQELRKLVASKTALEWEKTAQEDYQAGVVAAQTAEEWIRDPSAIDSRSVIPVKDPLLGATMQPGVPSLMLGSGDCAGSSPRHLPDEDRADILKELADRTAPQLKLGTDGVAPPLAGIRVLDFCQVLAGPICGRILAEYGAEVIKINNPRTYENPIAMVGHEAVNNGKLTTFLDMKSEEGKAVLNKLIRESDVFHCNFSQGVYERLGITEEQLREKNPGIILSQLNVHSLGGWREWERGHEDLGEAVAGITCRYGGGIKPETVPLLVCDNLTGQYAAIGVLLAIYHRMRTGEGQRVQACLSRTATLAQVPYMIGYEGKIWDEPAGPAATGWNMYDRIYATSDGMVYLANADADKLQRSGFFDGIGFSANEAERDLEKVFLSKTSEEWIKALCPLECDVRTLRNFGTECMEEPYAKASGLSRRAFHPGIGMLRTTACAPRLSLTPPVAGNAVCEAGGDTQRFLDSLNRA